MKRVFLLVILILVIIPIYSEPIFYMAPYGATNVNLDAPADWRVEKVISSGNGSPFEEDQTVIVGGLEKLLVEFWTAADGSDVHNYAIELSFDSDSYSNGYFWFTKQSDPEFKRPFQIQVMSWNYRDGAILGGDSVYYNYGFMGENGYTARLAAADDSSFLSNLIDIILGFLEGEEDSLNFNIMYFFGIILPGDIDNGILNLDGVPYPIAAGDDYSAEITVTAKVLRREYRGIPGILGTYTQFEPTGDEISFTVPFSGYYDPRYSDGTEKPGSDTSASLYVIPNARAANIDLLNDQGDSIPIANVDFSIFNLPISEEDLNGKYDKSVFMFLSANSNPFVSDNRGFRFVHEDVGFGDAETSANSIGYTISAIPSADMEAMDSEEDLIHPVEYDGTDFLDINGDFPLENKRMYTAHNEEQLGELFGNNKVHWHSYTGELVLNLDSNPVLMESGLYRSTVYVHVVTDDSLGGIG